MASCWYGRGVNVGLPVSVNDKCLLVRVADEDRAAGRLRDPVEEVLLRWPWLFVFTFELHKEHRRSRLDYEPIRPVTVADAIHLPSLTTDPLHPGAELVFRDRLTRLHTGRPSLWKTRTSDTRNPVSV